LGAAKKIVKEYLLLAGVSDQINEFTTGATVLSSKMDELYLGGGSLAAIFAKLTDKQTVLQWSKFLNGLSDVFATEGTLVVSDRDTLQGMLNVFTATSSSGINIGSMARAANEIKERAREANEDQKINEEEQHKQVKRFESVKKNSTLFSK